MVSTFGSAELAERESARVRGLHSVVQGADERGRAYAASDPELLRWVHLALGDAFLAAYQAVGRDLTGRFSRSWPDAYVHQWRLTRAQLKGLPLALGSYSPSEQAARYRLGLAPAPPWER